MPPIRGRKHFKPNNYHNANRNRRTEYRHYDQLSEKDVGITEYLGDLEGFSGIIKARYSDFQLNEIDLDGNVAKLTNTNVPRCFTSKMIQHNYNEVIESPNKNIPQETWEAIKALLNKSTSGGESVLLDIETVDKNARTEIHTCIKSHFGQKVIASTVQVDNKRHIEIKKYDKEEKTDIRSQWPTDKGEYVYFILYKEKMDTLEAIFKIASILNIKASKFTQAGNKDRRSISSQWFCVKKINPFKLINKTRRLFNIKIGNIEFRDEPLRLGQLSGNKFRIALRNVTASDQIICTAIDYLKENGYINYYGLQRFGNDKDVPTFQIGISLLQGKWKDAVDQILKPKSSDDPFSNQADIVKAKKVYSETGDATKAFEELERNKYSSVEGKLLEGLNNSNDNDFINALEKVPRQMRLLYLHSFQSLIWNKMVSKRLQVYGMKPVVGDLVIANTTVETGEMDVDDKDEDTETEIKGRKQVKALTEEDLKNHSVYDIVLPLPGYDTIYPDHMRDFYKESIEECGLDLEMTKQKVKTYNVSGDYRKILEKIDNITWKTVRYDNPTDNLILSDFEELKGHSDIQTSENGKYKAIILEFTLPACSYATMVLRQIMKVDTATNVQSKLNDYHTEEQKPPSKITSENHTEEDKCEVDEMSNSLLTNREKYEEFKNSIFNVISESVKTDNVDDDTECPAKKPKIEDSTNVSDT